MDHYVSESEQVDQIKRWWKDNGRALVFGLVVGLGGLTAYRYWDSSQTARAAEASLNYEHFLEMLSKAPDDNAVKSGHGIVEAYPGSIYARLTTLLLARIAVDKKDYPEAKKLLSTLTAAKDSGELANVARARLARILLAEGAVKEAQAALAAIPSTAGAERYAELRGDVLAASGDVAGARTKYLEAMVDAEKLGLDSEIVQLKLDNLTVATAGGDS